MQPTCSYCNKEYDDVAIQLHFNKCYEFQKVSGNIPKVPMYQRTIDYGNQQVTHKEFADLFRRCPDCDQLYDGSLINHEQRCTILQQKRIANNMKRNASTKEEKKTVEQEVEELRKEVKELKRKLETEK